VEDIDWDAVAAEMKKSREIPRKYASFFQWHNRDIMELGVCKHLGDYLSAEGRGDVSSYKLGEDPPDCIIALNGQDVAVEITELVDPAAIKEQVKHNVAYPDGIEWNVDVLAEKLNTILIKKDNPKDKADLREKSSQYWLVIHTDEPELMYPEFERLFDASMLVDTSLIDEVYVVFGYDPRVKCCPVKRVL